MQVQQEKFTPIDITIETEEEAQYIWNLLNLPISSVKEHCTGEIPLPDNARTMGYDMWSKFDDVFGKTK